MRPSDIVVQIILFNKQVQHLASTFTGKGKVVQIILFNKQVQHLASTFTGKGKAIHAQAYTGP